jgi:hypothetical protein
MPQARAATRQSPAARATAENRCEAANADSHTLRNAIRATTPTTSSFPIHQHFTSHSQRRGNFVVATHSANVGAATLVPPPQSSTPLSATILPTPNPANLPAEAFWTPVNAVIDPATGASFEYSQLKLGPDSKLWLQAGTRNTIHFIHPRDMPPGRKAIYLRIVATHLPHNKEPYRIRFMT